MAQIRGQSVDSIIFDTERIQGLDATARAVNDAVFEYIVDSITSQIQFYDSDLQYVSTDGDFADLVML